MKDKPKKQVTGRPPVGGYGTKSQRLRTSIRLPAEVCDFVESKEKPAGYVRDLIVTDFEKNK